MTFKLNSAVLFCLTIPTFANAESNRVEVQESLSFDGWQISFLSEFDQARSGDFSIRIGATSTCIAGIEDGDADIDVCYEHVRPIFMDSLPQAANSIATAVSDEDWPEDVIFRTLLTSLANGTVLTTPEFEAHVGLAVYQNWNLIVFERPVTTMRVRDLGFGIKTKVPEVRMERVTQRNFLPNTFQPFIRWKLIEGDPE